MPSSFVLLQLMSMQELTLLNLGLSLYTGYE